MRNGRQETEKQPSWVLNSPTFPSGVIVQTTEKVSLSLRGFKLHSSSHSSLGSMGTTCRRTGKGG